MYRSVDMDSGRNVNGSYNCENGRPGTENGHNNPYSQMESPVPPTSSLTMDHIIKAFNVEITASGRNHFSQLLMIISSGMYVVTTHESDGAIYWVSLILSTLIMANVVALIVFIVVRKRVFKKKDALSPVAVMQKTIKLQKIYGIISMVLGLLQLLFTVVTAVFVSGDTGGDPSNNCNVTSTAPMQTTTISTTTVMNNTFG